MRGGGHMGDTRVGRVFADMLDTLTGIADDHTVEATLRL